MLEVLMAFLRPAFSFRNRDSDVSLDISSKSDENESD